MSDEADREGRHAERDADRAQRRADRHAQRDERRRERAEWRAGLGAEIRDRIKDEIRQGVRRGVRRWSFGLGDVGMGAQSDGAEASEVVEHRSAVSGMPRVRVNNVSGATEITVGDANEVLVRARKRVRGWSEDRARRLLENVELRFEQEGNDILIEPRLFEQERGWLELFRGGRVAVDLDIRVPREAHLDASTVSGDLSVTGTRGPVELRSVSGEVSVDDVQGPLQLRSVSGDVTIAAYSGRVEANSVSGDIEVERSHVRAPDVVTVSGDVEIDAVHVPPDGPEARVKTVSGDVDLSLGDPDVEVDLRTVSGDTEVEGPARVEKEGRRDRRIVFGAGGARVRVKTVSGDLTLRAGSSAAPEAEAASPAADAMPMPPPSEPAPAAGDRAREVLQRLAKGELTVEEAATALDEARRT